MKLHALIQKSYQTFLEQLDSARVILLHPRSRYRSVLVAQLINSRDISTFYYAMGPDDIDVSAFISGITHDLANQYPLFGRHVNTLPDEILSNYSANAELILKTFAQDLREVSSDRYLFVLDEYDRSDSADDVQHFIEKLPDYMPPQCRLVINSRTLPRLPWISMIAQGNAVLVEDDHVVQDRFYDLTNTPDSKLEIYALGPSFVIFDNNYVDSWEGHLPRLLLFFALDRPMVTRSDICHAFWPELNPEQAVNVFHVTKRRLHKALNLDVLLHEDGYYRINPELPLYYDVLAFVQVLMQARNLANPNRMDALQKVVDLYRGPFLQGHDDLWIRERRVHYRMGYIEALTHIAKFWDQERNRPEQALVMYQKALSEDNRDETLHREVMRLFAKLGRRSEAAAHYHNLMQELDREKQRPSEETHALYEEIMS